MKNFLKQTWELLAFTLYCEIVQFLPFNKWWLILLLSMPIVAYFWVTIRKIKKQYEQHNRV